METNKMQLWISRMVYPGATVNNLTGFANRISARYGTEGLREFFATLCRMDMNKAMAVAYHLPEENRCTAEEYVMQELAGRCREADTVSELELLAIAACKKEDLLLQVAPFLTEEKVAAAVRCADVTTVCSLLQMSLRILPEAPCAWVREAFCQLLRTEYDERMEKVLPELLTVLLETDAVDVLSALEEVAGAQKVSSLYPGDLSAEVDRLILTGKDSVGVWELFFYNFFRREHTPEELLEQGLWKVQIFANDDVYQQACAGFYLHAAIHYGVDHPVFDYIDGFSSPNNDSHRYALRYRDAVRPLWNEPQALAHFLRKTAACNPIRSQQPQNSHYVLLPTAQDRAGYSRLHSLFEAGLSAEDIWNVFFSTNLKQRLPLEDVFYLAQRHEVLPQLLAALKEHRFTGYIGGQDERRIYVAPYSYYTVNLHAIPLNYKILEMVGYEEENKRREVQYVITAFADGYIHTSICQDVQLPENEEEDTNTWENAVEQLRREKTLRNLTEKRIKQLSITEFTLDSLAGTGDLDLFTQLIWDHADCLESFCKLLQNCKWNALFLNPQLALPDKLFGSMSRHRQLAVELFYYLLGYSKDINLVLQLYFSSIYRALVPLSQLLMLAERERFLPHLSNYVVYCRLKEEGSVLCRLTGISCAPVCSMESTEGISGMAPFAAVITDFEVADRRVTRITLQVHQTGAADVEERGTLFGYLANGIYISYRRAQRLATLPSAAQYRYRELKLNIRCMEDAIALRRTNATEMRRMIQILGNANPFAFGVSFATDRIYLNKRLRKSEAMDMAVTMFLNARNIQDIQDFYLHTYIKYHLRLPQLAALIRERRPDLADQIPEMFCDTVFCAIADNRGKLWMPWVAQDSVQVSQEYAGKALQCAVGLDSSGTVFVNVTKAEESETFLEILDVCLLCGYRTDRDMDTLVENLQFTKPTPAASPAEEETALSYNEYVSRLRRMPHSEQFDHQTYAQAIQKLMADYGGKSAGEIDNVIAGLTRKWLHIHPDRERIPQLLLEICRCYGQRYKSEQLCDTLTQLLYEYFGQEYSQAFEGQLGGMETAKPEKVVLANNQRSFEEVCEELHLLLDSTTVTSRNLLKQLGMVVYYHHNQVPAQQMEMVLAELTEKWLQRYTADQETLQDLLKLHISFVHAYQSGSFGLVLCRQAYQYMPPSMADILEPRICKTVCQYLGDHPDLQKMLPPFEQRFARLHSRFLELAYPINDAAKQIGKMVRNYSRIISREEMEKKVLVLTDLLMQQYAGSVHMDALVRGIHTSFESNYGASDIGKTMGTQAERYLDEDAACRLKAELGDCDPLIEQIDGQKPFEQVCRLLEINLQAQVTSQVFAGRICKLIRSYCAGVSEEEMKNTVLLLTEKWIVSKTEHKAIAAWLHEIHMQFMQSYHSTDLGIALCQLGHSQLEQMAANDLKMRIKGSIFRMTGRAPAEKDLLPSFGDYRAYLMGIACDPEAKHRALSKKICKTIRNYSASVSAEEMTLALGELIREWISRTPYEEMRMVQVNGIHDCFIRTYRTDSLGRLLCDRLAQYWGADEAADFEKRLEVAIARYIENNNPTES